jgi:hypothetical protein
MADLLGNASRSTKLSILGRTPARLFVEIAQAADEKQMSSMFGAAPAMRQLDVMSRAVMKTAVMAPGQAPEPGI